MAAAQDVQSQDSEIDVSVTDVTQLDVRPELLEYNSVSPGDFRTASDVNGYTHLDISNIGSTRIAQVYAEADKSTRNAFASGYDTGASAGNERAKHNTGDFVQISVETAASEQPYGLNQFPEAINSNDAFNGHPPHYVSRTEYFYENENQVPEFLTTTSGSYGTDYLVGKIREGDVEYYVEASLDDTSEPTVTSFRIGQAPHTPTQLGTTDLTSDSSNVVEATALGSNGDDYDVLNNTVRLVSFDTGNGNYGGEKLIQSSTSDGVLTEAHSGITLSDYNQAKVTEYSLAIQAIEDTPNSVQIEPHMIRERFAESLTQPSGGQTVTEDPVGKEAIFTSTSSENQFQPGQNFPVDVGIEVPMGVDQNFIENGQVTFYANSG